MEADPTVEELVQKLGDSFEVDAGNGHVWGTDYIRVRVVIDSRKPLRRGMKLSLKDGPVWVSFRYERLPHFCYCCGMLDHVKRDCELGLELEHMGVTERPYDDRLRAASKRERQEAATNNGRWLRDAAGFPTGENSRERHQLPKLGRRPDLEMGNVHGREIGMNGRDYRDATKNPVEQMSALNQGCQILQGYDICDGAPALNLNVPEKHSPTLGAPPPKKSGPSLSDNMEGQKGHNSDGPLRSVETQESDLIFVFSSTPGDNPPRTRSWKKEARERRHSSSHTLSSSCRIKRKDEQSQILVSPPVTMSLFCWNCRGLGNPRAVRCLNELVGLKQPAVVFLCETLLDKRGMDKVRRRLGFSHCFTVDKVGRSGGLAMLWKHDIQLSLFSYSRNHIDMQVERMGSCTWRFTGYYGHPERHNRRHSWQLLQDLATKSELPWLIGGDFNDLLQPDDKVGGNPQPEWMLCGFREVVEACNLEEIPMVGGHFTWRRGGVQEKLDRGLATLRWRNLFPRAKVRLLPPLSSDHSPLWVTLDSHYKRHNRRKKRFRFEDMWLRDPGCNETNQLKQCMEHLESLKNMPSSEAIQNEEQKVLAETEEWLEREETMWRQRSCEIWLQEGDRNTRFFHRKASRRRDKNRVEKLMDAGGEWKHGFTELQGIATSYFSSLFSTTFATNIDRVTSCLSPRVTADDNAFLLQVFTETEITKALHQMHPSKAPGPDGLSPGFLQNFWHVVKDDVVKPCLDFLNHGGILPPELNFTHIVLIPKCSEPKTMANLRPISLCNVIYRVLAKVLANRFKLVLQRVISQEQSAFLPNRLITDNFMIAYEILQYMRARKTKKRGWQAVKLDMSKAFDRIEWPYLEQVMQALGFADGWIRLIMGCVSSVTFEVLLNGREAGRVTPTRGLRQGDPLSPYLFILCAEGLTAMLNDAVTRGSLHSIQICRQAPKISHLFFADDSFLFLRATETEARNLMVILRGYEAASGQVINLQKSSITFSNNVQQRTRSCISTVLGMIEVELPGRYLGLPTYISRSRTTVFSGLKNRFWACISEWREQPLSRAGREVLIKSVLQSLPTYLMSLFLLPASLCTDLERIMNRYWWGGGEDEHKIHWMEWKKLATSKRTGGLGFRAMRDFNLAMLGKQGWRLLTYPDSLAARLMKAK
ncbi:hypothetical protein SLEP1_g50482, partial [Rubroshorea leprosula]